MCFGTESPLLRYAPTAKWAPFMWRDKRTSQHLPEFPKTLVWYLTLWRVSKEHRPELMARRVLGKVPAGSHGAERVTASDKTPVEIVLL